MTNFIAPVWTIYSRRIWGRKKSIQHTNDSFQGQFESNFILHKHTQKRSSGKRKYYRIFLYKRFVNKLTWHSPMNNFKDKWSHLRSSEALVRLTVKLSTSFSNPLSRASASKGCTSSAMASIWYLLQKKLIRTFWIHSSIWTTVFQGIAPH